MPRLRRAANHVYVEVPFMNANDYTVEIVKDPKVFQTLQPDWDRLFQRSDRPYLSQSFEWTWCVWE
jgi:hypothetical protein